MEERVNLQFQLNLNSIGLCLIGQEDSLPASRRVEVRIEFYKNININIIIVN